MNVNAKFLLEYETKIMRTHKKTFFNESTGRYYSYLQISNELLVGMFTQRITRYVIRVIP